MSAYFGTQGSYAPDTLLAGEFPRVTAVGTIASGQNLTQGAVLGKITASGKFVLSLSGAVDGSETPDAILAEDCDASAADRKAVVYLSGEFNTTALTIGTGHTAASIKDGLRARGIYLKSNLAA